ncbi:MAG: Cof-type HAD-IIB family hydrolase [Acidobacteriia bacterium]|nr:Cof-type HAD-IIB family hydrolase [Terriglobia bacterium]
MRFLALATDYDGTLAHHGEVSDAAVAALHRLRASGRKAILVTGREVPDLLTAFPHLELFDVVVAENGALLYFPEDRREEELAEAPPGQFLRALRERGVSPLSIGRSIVASTELESNKILDAIRSLGLELQVIFNKGSLMVLPSGVNKASGLAVALEHLGVSPRNVVGVGDAENDHALLRFCGCRVAVANALPALKERADIVTRGSHGEGVVELIDRLIAGDLDSTARH